MGIASFCFKGWLTSTVSLLISLFAILITILNQDFNRISIFCIALLTVSLILSQIYYSEEASEEYEKVKSTPTSPGFSDLLFGVLTFVLHACLILIMLIIYEISASNAPDSQTELMNSVFLIGALVAYMAGELMTSYSRSKTRYMEGYGYITPLRIICLLIILALFCTEYLQHGGFAISMMYACVYAMGLLRGACKGVIVTSIFLIVCFLIICIIFAESFDLGIWSNVTNVFSSMKNTFSSIGNASSS